MVEEINIIYLILLLLYKMYSNTPKTVIIITNNIYNINNRFLYDKNIIFDYVYYLKNKESYRLNKFKNSNFIYFSGLKILS